MANTQKSCLTCPSYLSENQSDKLAGKKFGAAVCGRFGHVLERPGMDQRQIDMVANEIGKDCNSHGEPLPSRPVTISLQVAEISTVVQTPVKKHESVTSCASCDFFVPSSTVLEDWGWGAGACVAKGKLILSTREIPEAAGCGIKKKINGPGTSWTLPPLLAHFDENFGKLDPVKEFLAARAAAEDPDNYPTDYPVSSIDQEKGIKAWRQVKDAESEKSVLLPVFDSSMFAANERAKIPNTGDDEHPELYVNHGNFIYKIAVAWLHLDETPVLWGAAGLGKTELYRHFAWMMRLPFERLSITASTELDDLAGKMLFKNNQTVWQNGRVPLAWSKPSVICIDEPNVGPPDVWQFFRPLTDNSKQLILDQNEGERIIRHEKCFMGMAMNPSHDARNVGANAIGDADGSRLLHIHMDLPPVEVEKQIITDRLKLDGWDIDTKTLNTLMKVAEEIRKHSEEETIPITWGIRVQIKVARALRWFDPLTAYRVAQADQLEQEAKDAILDVVKAHFVISK